MGNRRETSWGGEIDRGERQQCRETFKDKALQAGLCRDRRDRCRQRIKD